jgi:hypothetical protein
MTDKPFMKTNAGGTKEWYLNDKLHREDGPAVEWADGDKCWYLKGKLHREDGPAREYANGDKRWYLNGKRHREDGPAVEYADGDKRWYLNGKRHREDGPAVEHPDGSKSWYLNDTYMTEEDFRAKQKQESTLKEICGLGQEGDASDNVNNPSHYNQAGVECIDAIKASLGDGYQDYCKGNVIKYLWRYKYKNGIEDLKKAQWYLNSMVESVENG